MKRPNVRSESGFATLLALVMMGMLTLIGLAALSTSDDEVTIAGNEWQEMRAFYAAEAGLEKAASQLQFVYDSTGRPPTTMPQGVDSANNCIISFSTVDNGAATQRTLTAGTLSGLHALVKSFTINAIGVSLTDNAKVLMGQTFETALIPIFQFAVFYGNDLEIAPGATMTLIGRVHSNGSMWLQSVAGLRMDSYVTCSGQLLHGRKGPGSVDAGDVLIKNAAGSYVSMKEGSGWLEATDAHWYDSSVARWQGRVQDSAHGQGVLNVPLEGTSDDPHKLIEPAAGNPDSYESKASLKFIDRTAYQLVGGVWTNVTADMTTKGIISFTNNKFVDQRQNSAGVDVMELDVSKLYSKGYAPANGVVYYSDQTTDFPALRLKNGSQLGAPLTVASQNPVYTLGNYNSTNKQPAAILADAVTFLSGSWSDAQSSGSYDDRNATPTTVNASFLTGNVPTTSTSYSGGFENLPRFLEDWNTVNFTWSGSMVNLWQSVQANKPWTRTGVTYYRPPNRVWSYDTALDDPANLPPGTPVVRIFQRTGWKQEYVGADE
jgi:Tfp pilus assembly protein PilX